MNPYGGIHFPGLGQKELFVWHTPFGGYLLDEKTSPTDSSSLSYLITGNPGQQVLKIQWKNAGFKQWYSTSDPADFADFQVGLYEDGARIDVRFGPSSTDPGTYGYPGSISDPNPGMSFKWWFDQCSNVLMPSGPANLPGYQFLNICNPNYAFLDGTPMSGITYIINPE